MPPCHYLHSAYYFLKCYCSFVHVLIYYLSPPLEDLNSMSKGLACFILCYIPSAYISTWYVLISQQILKKYVNDCVNLCAIKKKALQEN